MQSQAELTETLNAVAASQAKTAREIKSVQDKSDELAVKVAQLEEALANQASVTPELAAAVQAVKDGAKALDDQIPDLPEVPPAEQPPV